jgi:hypothetical protein
MTDTPAAKRRILLPLVLAVSLLGNALAVGAVIKLRHVRADVIGDSAPLPRDLRRTLLAAMARDTILRASLAQVQSARAAFVTAATAKPYDPAATEAALTALRAEVSSLMQQGQTVVLTALAGANP